MSRRPSLPGAAELFRSTGGPGGAPETPEPTESRRAPERATDRLARLGAPREEEESAAAPATPADDFETGPPLRALSAEPAAPMRGLRPSTEDDFAESLPPRPPARIRQTRRQPLRGGADRRPSGWEKDDEDHRLLLRRGAVRAMGAVALRGDHGMGSTVAGSCAKRCRRTADLDRGESSSSSDGCASRSGFALPGADLHRCRLAGCAEMLRSATRSPSVLLGPPRRRAGTSRCVRAGVRRLAFRRAFGDRLTRRRAGDRAGCSTRSGRWRPCSAGSAGA
jgi:hypothetical protein